jgi:large subunit ribosomal protein L13
MKYVIDATNKKLGRLATETAVLLMGKDKIIFARNKMPVVTVEVNNLSKLSFTSKKKESTLYKRFSGYPGGLKQETLSKLSVRRGFGEVFKQTVAGMLPKNKLRSKMLKNLIVRE